MHPGAGTASWAILKKNWDCNQPTRPHLDQGVSLLMPLAPFSNSASVLTLVYDSVPKKYLRITELFRLLRCSVWPGWPNFHPVFHLALNVVDGARSPHLIPRDFQSWNFCAKNSRFMLGHFAVSEALGRSSRMASRFSMYRALTGPAGAASRATIFGAVGEGWTFTASFFSAVVWD